MPECLCDGGAYEVKKHPFIVNEQCEIHSKTATPSRANHLSAEDLAELERLVAHAIKTPTYDHRHAARTPTYWADRYAKDVPRLLAMIKDYERGINWNTTCTNCAKLLESSHADYERAEKAEADVEIAKRVHQAQADRIVALNAKVEQLIMKRRMDEQ